MISSQDKYLAGIITGEQTLTKEQYPCCEREGLLPLARKFEPALKDQYRKENSHNVAVELAHQLVVIELLDQLGETGIDCLVFKGTALAYSHYEQPWHRSRVDTDLWIRERDVDAAFSALRDAGFQQQVSMPGRIACGECAFERTDRFGAGHSIDLHWRFNNNWMLAGAAGFEELWRDRIPLRALGSHAWTCTNPFALLIACVHRGAHLDGVAYKIGDFSRLESDSTLWLYDIHMLSESLSDSEWVYWSGIVINRGFSEFAISGLERSCLLFGGKVPGWVLSDLREAPGQLSMASLESRVSSEWQSFCAVDGFRKFGFIKQQLFPDAAYMRARYESTPLLLAHLKRLFSGVIKRLS